MTDNNNTQKNISKEELEKINKDKVIQELHLTLKLRESGGSLEADFLPKLNPEFDENNKQTIFAYEAYRLFEKMIETELPFAIIYNLITTSEEMEIEKVVQIIEALQKTTSMSSSNDQQIH